MTAGGYCEGVTSRGVANGILTRCLPLVCSYLDCLLSVFALVYLFVYTTDHFLMTSQSSLVGTGGSETIQGTTSRVCFSLSVVQWECFTGRNLQKCSIGMFHVFGIGAHIGVC